MEFCRRYVQAVDLDVSRYGGNSTIGVKLGWYPWDGILGEMGGGCANGRVARVDGFKGPPGRIGNFGGYIS